MPAKKAPARAPDVYESSSHRCAIKAGMDISGLVGLRI